MTIEDKAVLVTRGIGQALVEEALRRGAKRVYAGTRQPLAHLDGRVTPVTLDVTNAAQIQEAGSKTTMFVGGGRKKLRVTLTNSVLSLSFATRTFTAGTQKITEWVPDKKAVWHVSEAQLLSQTRPNGMAPTLSLRSPRRGQNRTPLYARRLGSCHRMLR